MENFQINMAIGFILAGIVIRIFKNKQALFWGATLVVGAVTAFTPAWGLVTLVEIAIGWIVAEWMISVSKN